MADKNIQMTQRNTANDGWDNLFPKTKASNVFAADGTNLEDHKINTTTAHGIGNKIDKSLLTQKGQMIYASAAGTLAVLNPGSDGQTIVYSNGVPTAGNVDNDVYIAGVDTTIFSGAVAYQKKGTTPRITATCAVSIPGTYRISFQLHASTSGGSYTAYGQIYVNGVAKGIQRSTQSSSYVTFTEDIHLNKGDTVALYVWCNTTTDGQYSAYAYAAGLTFTVGKGVVLSASDTSN